MRLLRIVICLLILAAVAAAQSTSPTNDPAQNPQPGQAPQSPLADQPTSQQQQQQAEAQSGKPSSFDVSGAATGEQDQELGEVRMMTRYSQIGGSPTGQARSFHNPGSNNLAEFNYFLDHRLFGTGYRFQFLSMFRGTDDTSIDPERNSVQKGYVRLYSPRQEFIFGDALVNYSRLTFNQNIKGVSTSTKIGQSWKFSTVGGVFIDRYGSLFKDQPQYANNYTDPATGTTGQALFGCYKPDGYSGTFVALNDPQCGRPFTSLVSGARLEYALMRDSAIGFNFSSSDDLRDTRREQPFNTAPNPASNRVGSIDLKLQRGMFRLDTEFAYSGTNFDTRLGTCLPSAGSTSSCDSRQPTPGFGFQSDWGGRLDASYRHKRWTFRGSYVRFQPNFASMNARQISDSQDILFRTSYDIANWLTIDGTMRRYNDDLKGQKPFQQTLWGPEGRLIFHDLSFYRKAVFEMGYRHRIIDGFNPVALYTSTTDPNTGVVTKTIQAGCVPQSSAAGMVCADRTVRTPFAELTLPVSTTFFTVGYERRQSMDRLKPSGTTNTNRFYGGLRGIYDVGGWHINPSVRYEFERQGHRLDPDTFVGLPANQFTYLNPIQLLELNYDNNRLATGSIYVETPRWFIIELQFRTSTATSTTPGTLTVPCTNATRPPCTTTPLQTTITSSVPSPAGYSRPSYRANITYKIANDENKMFIFSFERNNNFYFSGPTDQNVTGYAPGGALNPINFDERMIGVTFVYKFGKRAR